MLPCIPSSLRGLTLCYPSIYLGFWQGSEGSYTVGCVQVAGSKRQAAAVQAPSSKVAKVQAPMDTWGPAHVPSGSIFREGSGVGPSGDQRQLFNMREQTGRWVGYYWPGLIQYGQGWLLQ